MWQGQDKDVLVVHIIVQRSGGSVKETTEDASIRTVARALDICML